MTDYPPRRRSPTPEERQSTINRAMIPGALSGRVPGIAPVTGQTRKASAQARGVTGVLNMSAKRHQADILKAEGVAPASTYTLTFLPADEPYWPQVFAGGALQHEGVDYEMSGRTLTVLEAMELQAGELLYCDYDYLAGMPFAPTPLSWTVKFVSKSASWSHSFQVQGGSAIFRDDVAVAGDTFTITDVDAATVYSMTVVSGGSGTFLSTDAAHCTVTAITGGRRFAWEDGLSTDFNDLIVEVYQ